MAEHEESKTSKAVQSLTYRPSSPTQQQADSQSPQEQLHNYNFHPQDERVPTGNRPSLKERVKLNVNRKPYAAKLTTVLPRRVVYTIASLAAVNVLVWIAAGVVLHYNPSLASSALLAYTLGLRHALDADHIAAIDLVARRLSGVTGRIGLDPPLQDSEMGPNPVAEQAELEMENDSLLDIPSLKSKKPPTTIGLFFSLGHSTVVIITAIVTAATAAAVSKKFDRFSRIGGIIGTSVSTAFLILLSAINANMLYCLIKQMKKILAARRSGRVEENIVVAGDNGQQLPFRSEPTNVTNAASTSAIATVRHEQRSTPSNHLSIEGVGGGVLFRIFRALFRFVDRPWKMYPLGFVFGLGFDTSSEIALLGLAAVQAARGTSIWLILIFPILFTAGMALLDTTDGALMVTLYVASSRSKDGPVAILYYSIVLTAVTVTVSAMIGIVQALNLAGAVGGYEGPFWDGLDRLGEVWDIVGGAVCGSFVVFGLLSVVLYKPWRRRYDPAYKQ